MCNCKSKIEEKFLELFKAKNSDKEDHRAELSCYGICINRETGVFELAPFMPMKATFLHTFKNGNKKIRTAEQNIFLNYCPFCGEKLREGVKVTD